MSTTMITVTGNLVADPTTRETKAGVSVTNFRIASTERRYDKQSQQWVDGNSFFATVACWRQLAQNAHVSLKKGMPVVVVGRISTRTWTDDEEQSHTVYEIEADTVAPDLSWGTAVFAKVIRGGQPAVSVDENGMPSGASFDEPFDVVGEHGEAERELVGSAA